MQIKLNWNEIYYPKYKLGFHAQCLENLDGEFINE